MLYLQLGRKFTICKTPGALIDAVCAGHINYVFQNKLHFPPTQLSTILQLATGSPSLIGAISDTNLACLALTCSTERQGFTKLVYICIVITGSITDTKCMAMVENWCQLPISATVASLLDEMCWKVIVIGAASSVLEVITNLHILLHAWFYLCMLLILAICEVTKWILFPKIF